MRASLGLFTGWITLAAAVGTGQALAKAGVGQLGLGATGWAVLVLAAVGAIAATVTVRVPASLAYPAAVIWGLIGITANTLPDHPPVATAAALTALALGAAAASTTRAAPRSRTPWTRRLSHP